MKVSIKGLKTLNWTLIFIIVFAYGLNKLFLEPQFNNSFFSHYFSDLLFVPFLNAIVFLSLIQLYSRRIPWFFLFLSNFGISCLFFEFIFPKISPDQTADIVDCIVYLCGLGIYLILFAIYDTNNLLQIRR